MQKRQAIKLIMIIIGLGMIFQGPVSADDFFDVIGYKVNVREYHDRYNVVEFNPVIYGAKTSGAWIDLNKDGHWDTNEVMTGTIRIFDRNGKLAIETPANLNRDQLQDWAEENARTILDTVFPSGISQATGTSDDGIMAQAMFDIKLFKKAVPAAKAERMLTLNHEFKGALEHLFMEVDNNDGMAESIVLGYAYDSPSGPVLGFLLPYRYAQLDDEIDTKSHFIGLDLYFKTPVVQRNQMVLNVGADISGSIYYLSSDAIKHAGNYKYGAGLFTSFAQTFGFGGTLSLGLDYKYSKAKLKASLVDTDNTFVEEAIDYVNDLDPVHNISYGINFGVPIGESTAINLETVRTHFISDDIPSDREVQTVAGISVSFYPTDAFELSLGIRKTFELEDIDVTGIMIGCLFRF